MAVYLKCSLSLGFDNIHIIIIFQPIFPHIKVKSFEITNSVITSKLTSKIDSVVHAFSHLQTLIISQPTSIEQFPHLTSIPCLNLIDIPFDCADWKWLSSIRNLNEFKVSFRGTKAQLGSLHVLKNRATLNSIADTNTISTFLRVMSHLPMTCSEFDAFIPGRETELGSIKIANDKATLKMLPDNNTTAALAYILSHVRMCVSELYVSISERLGIPGELSANSERVEIKDVNDEEASLAIGKILGNIPENMRKEVDIQFSFFFFFFFYL